MNDVEALQRAQRLTELGLIIRSAELRETASIHRTFLANGGNRAMRRAAKRAQRRRGH